MTDDGLVRAARALALAMADVVADEGRSTVVQDDSVVRERIVPLLASTIMQFGGKFDVPEIGWPPGGKLPTNDIGPEIWCWGDSPQKFTEGPYGFGGRHSWRGVKALGWARMEYAVCETLWRADPEPMPTNGIVASLEPYLHMSYYNPTRGSLPVVLRRLATNGFTINHNAGSNRMGKWNLTDKARQRFEWVERTTGYRK